MSKLTCKNCGKEIISGDGKEFSVNKENTYCSWGCAAEYELETFRETGYIAEGDK